MSDNEIKEQEIKDIQEDAVPDATDISALLAEDPDAANAEDAAADAFSEEKPADNITSEEEKLAPAEEKPAEEAPVLKEVKIKDVKKVLTPDELKRKNTREWIKDIGIAAIIAIIFLQLITPTLVREHSMENTLRENDYVIVSRRHYSWLGNDLQRGDIIVFSSELTTGLGFKKVLVKRVIALPGDTISITAGKVYVNGEEQDQSFTKDGYTASGLSEVTVPEGHIFVMGDNRQNSTDSRNTSVGFVDINRVRGKVVFRLFPLSRAGGF